MTPRCHRLALLFLPTTLKIKQIAMPNPAIELSVLQPLEVLRVRTRGAYEGTITAPGKLVSDGKILFVLDRVLKGEKELAASVADKASAPPVIPQEKAAQVFEAITKEATKKATVLGQLEKPGWVRADGTDRLAVLRYGRGRSTRYVFVSAYRLLLLKKLLRSDEVRCAGPHTPVLLRRRGKAVGALTALTIEPQIKR